MESSWNIVGHGWAVDYLRRSVARSEVAHAYLLSGPAGIGKAMLAVRLAQALLCERGDGDPCQVCRSCRRIASGNHPDVRMVSLATQAARQKADEAKSREMRIDTVREWQRDIDLRPFESTRRVFILDDADKLNDQAANAMLKTLEEPPPYAVIILIAQGAGDLLPTIVSRCRVLRLRPVPRDEIASALQTRKQVVPAQARLLAAWSGGRTGWALTAADDPGVLETQQAELDMLAGLRDAGRIARLKWAEERAKEYRADQFGVLALLNLWQNWWRDVLLSGNGCADALTYQDRADQIGAVAAAVPLPSVYGFLRHLDLIREQLADNVNPQLALENLVLHLP